MVFAQTCGFPAECCLTKATSRATPLNGVRSPYRSRPLCFRKLNPPFTSYSTDMESPYLPRPDIQWSLGFHDAFDSGDFVEKVLLAAATAPPSRGEMRRERRHPYPVMLEIWPIDADGRIDFQQPVTVLGKQISQGGLGFYHHRPIPQRVMVVRFPGTEGILHRLRLKWCRFLGEGWYDSGGKFDGVLVASDPSALPTLPE